MPTNPTQSPRKSSEVNRFVAGLPAGLASFTYHCALACLELYCRSVLDLACFFGLSMLPSYCRGVLIALRVNAESRLIVPNARKPAFRVNDFFIFARTIVLWHVGSSTGSR